MTDKQIIIDGIDVSGCEFYSYIESNKYPHRCSCYEDMYGASVVCDLTDCCKNCHYKNWKRKEQECVRYAKINEQETKDYAELLKQLDQLKSDNKHLNGLLDQALKELEEHREALEKVREIAQQNHKTEEELFKIRHSRLPKFSMGALNGKHNLASEILQICDEVTNEH